MTVECNKCGATKEEFAEPKWASFSRVDGETGESVEDYGSLCVDCLSEWPDEMIEKFGLSELVDDE